MNSSVETTSCGGNSPCWDLEGFSRVFLVLEFVQTLLVLLTNGTTLFILVKNDLLETSSNIFIACLSAADMFSAACLPFRISVEYLDPGTGWNISCFGNMLTGHISSMINIITLFVIATDRLFFFIYSLEYHSMVPVTKAIHVVYSVWGVTFAFCAATLAAGYEHSSRLHSCVASSNMNRISRLTYGIPYLILIPATIGIYIKIGMVAWKQSHSIAAASITNQSAPPAAEESKITKVMLNVLVIYITCNLVVVFIPVALSHLPEHLQLIAVRIGYCVWRVNRWINPFIYAGKSKKFRQYVVKLFSCCSSSPSQTPRVF